jgi:hypothetical protein
MYKQSYTQEEFNKISDSELGIILAEAGVSGFTKQGTNWTLKAPKETPKDTRITKSKFVGKDRLGKLVIKAKVYIGDVFLGSLDIKNKDLQLIKF